MLASHSDIRLAGAALPIVTSRTVGITRLRGRPAAAQVLVPGSIECPLSGHGGQPGRERAKIATDETDNSPETSR